MIHPVLSVIIPVYNEEAHLTELLNYLMINNSLKTFAEIIVSDGGSEDKTLQIAQQKGVKVVVGEKGRAAQLNAGAQVASGQLYYFLHADSVPPTFWFKQIVEAYEQGYIAGSFRLKFDWSHWFLKLNALFTRFSSKAFRFGDQSLFVTRDVFNKIGGFRNDHFLMEDQEVIYRITKHGLFKVMPDYIITSARKYRVNGPYRMQFIFYYIYAAYKMGVSQNRLKTIYQTLIKD